MRRDETYQIMGPPTSESEESASWDAFQYQFTAFFDVDEEVRQLDVNEINLSDDDRAEIDCEFTRTAD